MAKKIKMVDNTDRDIANEVCRMVEDAIEKARMAESCDSHGALTRADELNYEVENIVGMIYDLLRSEGL